MKKFLAISVVVLLAMFASVIAQPGHPGMGNFGPGFKQCEGQGEHFAKKPKHHKKPGIEMILKAGDEIGLTDKQRNELEMMMVDFAMEKVDRKADVKKAKIRLAAIMRNENTPESEVLGAIDEVAGLKAELKKMKYLHRRAVKSVLKEEQIEKLKELRKERCNFGKEEEVEIELKKRKMYHGR